MSRAFEEIDHQTTPLGDISLRRRLEPVLQVDIWEVKLGDEFLMSSLFTASEEAVATLGLAACVGNDLDVVVGGLGLGYTAVTALADDRVTRLQVIEALPEVIGWHRDGLVPLGTQLTDDVRCTLRHDDFFTLVENGIRSRWAWRTVLRRHPGRHRPHPEPSPEYRQRELLRPGGVRSCV